MPTTNPRINVTFNEHDAEILKHICSKKKMTMSGLVRKVMEDWIEDYEDILLAKRAQESFDRWEKSGSETISHEEIWQSLDIE